MGQKLRRRSVYLATIVAILAMVGGFALASGLFGGFGTITVNGNQGAVTTADTIYEPGVSASLFTVGAGGAGGTCTAPVSSGSSPVVVTAWLQGGPGACTATSDYVLQLTFTSASQSVAKTYTDSFVISSEFGSAVSFTTGSAVIACTLTVAPTECQAVINIDTGVPATAAQPALDAVDVTVTGS